MLPTAAAKAGVAAQRDPDRLWECRVPDTESTRF